MEILWETALTLAHYVKKSAHAYISQPTFCLWGFCGRWDREQVWRGTTEHCNGEEILVAVKMDNLKVSSLTDRVSNYLISFKKDTFWSGLKRGKSLVPNLQDLWGLKSQTSSGTWWGRSTSRSAVDCPAQLMTKMKGVKGKSATWSNTCISAPTTWSWHCWSPSWKIQPAPQSFKGCRSHL